MSIYISCSSFQSSTSQNKATSNSDDKTFPTSDRPRALVLNRKNTAMSSGLPASTAAAGNSQPTPVPQSSSPPAAAKSKDLKSWWSRFNVARKAPATGKIILRLVSISLENLDPVISGSRSEIQHIKSQSDAATPPIGHLVFFNHLERPRSSDQPKGKPIWWTFVRGRNDVPKMYHLSCQVGTSIKKSF